MISNKEYFLALLNELKVMSQNLDEVPFHYRLEELLKARDEMTKECLVTLGIIEFNMNKGTK